MEQFTIKDIELLSGIKAHTLRIWEQRFNIIIPKRKESNHRFYDNEDLKHILRIAHLYNNGVKISKIAHYNEEDLKRFAVNTLNNNPDNAQYINRLMEAALDFNETLFEEVIEMAIQKTGFQNCMLEIVYPYLKKVGVLWLTDSAIPAQEHFSSNIIRHKIIVQIDKLPTPQKKENDLIALFTPENEFHELPLLMMQYFFKKNNRKTIYIGANVSLEALKTLCAHKNISTLFCYGITNFTKVDIDVYILNLSALLKPQNLVVAGPIASQVNISQPNLTVLGSLKSQIAFIENR